MGRGIINQPALSFLTGVSLLSLLVCSSPLQARPERGSVEKESYMSGTRQHRANKPVQFVPVQSLTHGALQRHNVQLEGEEFVTGDKPGFVSCSFPSSLSEMLCKVDCPGRLTQGGVSGFLAKSTKDINHGATLASDGAGLSGTCNLKGEGWLVVLRFEPHSRFRLQQLTIARRAD